MEEQVGHETNPSAARLTYFRKETRLVTQSGGIQKNGERKQKEIYGKTKTQSREDRARIQKARRQQKGSVETRLGDREQIGKGWEEERLGSREKEEQSVLAQRRQKGRQEIRREEETLVATESIGVATARRHVLFHAGEKS